DLRQNRFMEWPQGIFSLKHITRLDIASNEFRQLPPHLGLLETLQSFLFDGNPLRALPRVQGTQALMKRLRERIPEGEEDRPPVAAPRRPTTQPSQVTALTEATAQMTVQETPSEKKDEPSIVPTTQPEETTPTPPTPPAVQQPTRPPNVELE